MAVLHFPGFQHFWSLLKALLDLKAPLESPELTGDPTAPTQEPHDNSTKVATTEYVDSAVAELVNSSPAALDTLKELSDAIGGDANFSTTMTNALALKAPLASPALLAIPPPELKLHEPGHALQAVVERDELGAQVGPHVHHHDARMTDLCPHLAHLAMHLAQLGVHRVHRARRCGKKRLQLAQNTHATSLASAYAPLTCNTAAPRVECRRA